MRYRIGRSVRLLLLASLLVTVCCAGARRPAQEPELPAGEELQLRKAEILRAEDRRVVDEALLAALGHSSARIRVLAVRGLGRIGDPTSRSAIEDALGDENGAVRGEAAFALGHLGDAASLPALRKLLDDPELRVRALLAAGLGLIHDRAGGEDLLRLVSDSDPNVVQAACHALAGFPEAR